MISENSTNIVDQLIMSSSCPQEELVSIFSKVLRQELAEDNKLQERILKILSVRSEAQVSKMHIFNRCQGLCEEYGNKHMSAIFRCMVLWPIVEAIEALIEPEFRKIQEIKEESRRKTTAMAEKSKISDSREFEDKKSIYETIKGLIGLGRAREMVYSMIAFAEEMSQLLSEDLRRAANDLEDLCDILGKLGAISTLKRAHLALRWSLALYARTLMKNEKWTEAVLLRARYLRSYYLAPSSISPDRPRQGQVHFNIVGPLGTNMVGIHFKAKAVHGTLLLENISGQNELLCLGNAEILGHIDIKRFAEDLVPLRFQFSSADWEDFSYAYTTAAGSEEAQQVLKLAEEIAPDSQLDREEEKLPFYPLETPHWIIRAIRFSLRHSKGAKTNLRKILDEALVHAEPEKRIRQLQIASLAAENIDTQLYYECLQHLVSELQELILCGETTIVQQQAQISQKLFSQNADEYFRTVFLAQEEHATVLEGDNFEEKESRYYLTSELYFKTGDAALWNVGLQCLEEAKKEVRTDEEIAALTYQEMRLLINMGIASEDGRYIDAAIQLFKKAKDIPDLYRPSLSALAYYAEALIEPKERKRKKLLQKAKKYAEKIPEMSDFIVYIDEMLLDMEPGTDIPEIPKSKADRAIHFAMKEGDWTYAVEELTREVSSLSKEDNKDLCAMRAGQLALVYLELSDKDPRLLNEAVVTVSKLAAKYATHIPQIENRDIKQEAASGLGWALARLPTGQELTRKGVELLELAVSLRSREDDIVRYSFILSNLANAYRSLAYFQDSEERKKLLMKAEKLLREVVSIDEQLSESEDPREHQAGETLCLDYMNLGLIRKSLADATYDRTCISEKPLESAQYLRDAIKAFSYVIEKYNSRPAITATAQIGLAGCFITLCQHYCQERHWAGGDLERAFYDWMCGVAGSHINTHRWIMLCAESALSMAASAAYYGAQGNVSVMVESIETIVDLWCLLRCSDEMPEHVKLHCAMTITELWDYLLDSGRATGFAEQFKGLEETVSLARATCHIDLFRKLENHNYLLEGFQALEECTRSDHPVVKGIARLALKWLRVEPDANGCSTNGLYLGSVDSSNLELRFPDQRRTIEIKGVGLFSSGAKLVHRRSMLVEIGHAIAHLEPMLDIDRLPEFFAVGTGIALGQDAEYDVETMRIPTPSWDSWLVNLSARRDGELTLEVAAPFLGRYDPFTREFSHEFPAQIEKPYEVLSFGQRGISIEILMPGEEQKPFSDHRGFISADNSREHPLVHIEANGCRILFKTAPRIVSCETAILIKDEGAKSALCCGNSPPVTSPSRSFPSNSINSFAPIFFFKDKIDQKVISFFHGAEIRSLMIVGQPDHGGEICRLLKEIYDPALEVSFVVTEDEAEQTLHELDDFSNVMSQRLGSRALFAFETAYVGETNPLCNVQFVLAPRLWAPASVQMLMDLSQLRRVNLDGVPIFLNGKVRLLNSKGNVKGMRRLQTMLSDVSSFEGLVTLYSRSQRGMTKIVYKSNYTNLLEDEQFERFELWKVPKRPLYVLPDSPQDCVALAPHIRLNQAIPVPMDEMIAWVIEELEPQIIYSSFPSEIGELVTKSSGCKVSSVSLDPKNICEAVAQTSDDLFSNITDEIHMRYPHLKSQSSLLESLRPSRYAVLCTWSDKYAAWAIALANYAAALGGPILFTREPSEADINHIKRGLTILNELKNPANFDIPSAFYICERKAADILRKISSYIETMIQPQIKILEKIEPRFLGVATPFAVIPLELAGSPALALRFSTGRISGPDLTSTCEIIANAALAEEFSRKVWLEAILIGASGIENSILESVLEEIESTKSALGSLSFTRVSSMVDNPDDLDFLNSKLHLADLFHFAGHASSGEGIAGDVKLSLTKGPLTVKELPSLLENHPIIFANACSSAVIESIPGETTRGLASEFLKKGAINYIGNLWPVLDDTAARMAQVFYQLLCSGMTVGEALLLARKSVSSEDVSSWGAIILFGCPRNRIVNV